MRQRSLFARLVVVGVAGLLPATLAAPTAAAAFDLPPIDRIVHYQPRLPLTVLTADGVEIAQFGVERRIYVPLARMPRLLQQAVLSVEDWRFHEHSGIDPRGMARALLSMMTGGQRQGASTITQQLVRTMLLTRELTAERKAKEIMLALKVEEALPKERILEIYLNEIFLGQRAYGFAAAAQTYFGKTLDQLSIAETALLAGLPQNPHYANPVANLARAIARQRHVLDRMRAVSVIDDAQLARAKAEKITIRSGRQPLVNAGHVAEMARQAVVQRFGTDVYSSGMTVTTSLRAADQQAAYDAVRRGVVAYDRRGAWRGPEGHEDLPAAEGVPLERAAAQALKAYRDDDALRVGIVLAASPKELTVQLASGERVVVQGAGLRWAQRALRTNAKAPLKLDRGAIIRVTAQAGPQRRTTWTVAQWPQAEAALVAMDPRSGRVRALVGGFDFSRQPFNHATQGWRQPGSAFKPLLVSAALEERVMPATVIDDLPYTGADGWSPGNSDGQFLGPITLRTALAASRNMVSVRLLSHVGTARAREWAARFGLDPQRQPDTLTLALGTGSVTPMQMTQAYATFANGGWAVAPVVIERITDAQGRVIFEAPPPQEPTEANRVLPARNVFVTSSMLGDVTRVGTAAAAQNRLRRQDIFGKTGTTNDAFDAWFAGFQPSLAAVVWLGYDEPRSLGDRESGGGAALPIWIDFMAAALKGVPPHPPPIPPEGVVRAGEDWLYTEWRHGGWVSRISADAGVQYATPPEPAPEAGSPASAPGEAPGGAPRDGSGATPAGIGPSGAAAPPAPAPQVPGAG